MSDCKHGVEDGYCVTCGDSDLAPGTTVTVAITGRIRHVDADGLTLAYDDSDGWERCITVEHTAPCVSFIGGRPDGWDETVAALRSVAGEPELVMDLVDGVDWGKIAFAPTVAMRLLEAAATWLEDRGRLCRGGSTCAGKCGATP